MSKTHYSGRKHIKSSTYSRSRGVLRKCCEGLERRLLLSTTVNVVANSTGSYGGADVTGVTLYDDLNNNGVLDSGEPSTGVTEVNDGDPTDCEGQLTIDDDGATHHLNAVVPNNEVGN